MSDNPKRKVTALVVRQWLKEWDLVHFSEQEHRRKPEQRFLMFTLQAYELRRLSKIYRRKAKGPRVQDTYVQLRTIPGVPQRFGVLWREGFLGQIFLTASELRQTIAISECQGGCRLRS